MGTSLSKTQLLTELRNEQTAWEALLDEIGEAHMTQPEVAGGWSIKDIVAHLTGWRRRSVRRFQALLHHEPDFSPPWPPELQDDDEINAWIYESNRDRPLADILSDSREVFQQLVDTLDAFSEDELQDLRRRLGLEEEQISGSTFFDHFHEEHEPDMRAWLDKVKKER
ncbi:MAG TPA: ClbS/DfsB family four-helix bundle protein [Ktedonobacteraceae bacterium]|nr:ClbS/DfsB family four-helix bundle protein [Ktedonobacteraceae bacterium]